MATVYQTRACSHGEIHGIASDKAEKIVADVCADALTTRHYGDPPNGVLFSFYIFSASMVSTGKENYGNRLAAFIKSAGLGDVIETPEMVNLKFHSSHSNKVFIWVVNHDATKKWYGKHLKNGSGRFKMKMEDFNNEVDPNLLYEEGA